MGKVDVLVVVKAYPNPSKRYVETVCTAGIDINNKKWIRLYPVPFRDLEKSRKFKKYDIIRVDVEKSSSDPRPESYKINSDSIKVIRSISSKNGWKERKEYVLPMKVKSMCEIQRECKECGVSLGMIKPNRVDLIWEKVTQGWKSGVEEQYAQLSLFNPQKQVIEKIPYVFRYKYYCENEPGCNGHSQCIVDWEIGESYRSWLKTYKTEEKTLAKIKEKWIDKMCGDDRDTYFFVGNQHIFKTFMVLGVFWPPRKST